MSDTLKAKTIKGVMWSGIERFSTAGINFVIGLIIARMLSPEEYGIIAMLAVFMSVSQAVIDSGFSNALTRKNDRTEADYSTTFYFNIVVGLVMYVVLFFGAPLIADFYNMPLLEIVTKVVGTNLIWMSLSIVQQSILTIKVDFKTQMWVSLYASIISGIIGILMAYYGYGVWALVGQMVSVQMLRTVALWVVAKWRPTASFSLQSFRYLFGYGSKLLIAGLLETIYRNLYTIVIGKFFKANALGIYNRGEQFASYGASNITGVIQRVTFPVLSKIQDDRDLLNRAFTKILRTTCYLVFPVMTYLYIAAEPMVKIVLTNKWIECVPVIQILCLSYMWYPIHILNLNVLQVSGRSDLFLRIEIVKKVVGTAILLVTLPFGVIIMCWGRVVYCYIELFINMYYTNKIIGLTFGKQLKLTIPFFLYCIAIFLIAYLVKRSITNDILIMLVDFVIIGIVWLTVVSRIERIDLKELINKH